MLIPIEEQKIFSTYPEPANIGRSDDHPFKVVSRHFYRLGKKTTVCLLVCDCGLEITGTSACVNPGDYNASDGKKYSYKNAESKRKEYIGVHCHV